MKRTPILVVIGLAAGALQAEAPRPLQGFLNATLTFGGDSLATMAYSDGSSDSVKAGGTRLFKGGINYTFTPKFSMQASYGMHLTSTKKATNGSIDFDRNFFEGLAFYHTSEIFKVGGGLRKVIDAQMKGFGAAAPIGTWDFKSDLSLVVEAEWHTRHLSNIQWGLNVRYVNEKFTPEKWNGYSVSGSSVDGSHFGVGVSFYF